MVDDDNFHGTLPRLESQAQLIPQRREERWSGGVPVRRRCRFQTVRDPLQREIILSLEAGMSIMRPVLSITGRLRDPASALTSDAMDARVPISLPGAGRLKYGPAVPPFLNLGPFFPSTSE